MPQSLADNAVDFKNAGGPDFTLSPYLLLPDSFGDIYAGEKFSAYIAVVNGFAQVPFYQVTLAVRLQTSTTVIDLADTRMQSDANASKTLSCNETFDMIVAQTLNELGIHTLRVSVQYLLTPTSEVKTLRKFYRFNVLQPLVIQSSYVELNGKPMVQCEVTNATKSPIYIDEVSQQILFASSCMSYSTSHLFYFILFLRLLAAILCTDKPIIILHSYCGLEAV